MDILSGTTEKGVTERRFDLKVGTEVVPGILWEPEAALAAGTPRPTVLIGHGGTQHKRVDTVLAFARRFVRHLGVSVAALDAPGHGERVTPEMKAAADAQRAKLGARIVQGQREGRSIPMEMSDAEARAWVERTTGGVAEWKALLDDLQASRPDLAAGPFGYWACRWGWPSGCRSSPTSPASPPPSSASPAPHPTGPAPNASSRRRKGSRSRCCSSSRPMTS